MVDVPVVVVAQVPQVHVVMKTVETSQLVSDVQAPRVRVTAETAEIPQLPFVKKIGAIWETAEIRQFQSDVRGVVQNIGIDSFIDDLSSVDSRGLSHQDCEGLFQVGKQRPDIAGGVHVNRDDLHAMLAAEGTQQPHRSKQHHGNQQQQATNKQRTTKKERKRKGVRKKRKRGRGERVKEERRRKEGTLRKKSASRSRRT